MDVTMTNQRPGYGQDDISGLVSRERGERMLWRVRKWILLSQDIDISKYRAGRESDQKSHWGAGN